MKRLFLLLFLPICAVPTKHKQKIPVSYAFFEEDMNTVPLVMDEALYKMSCTDIQKHSVAIKVLQEEIHAYMIKTDLLAQKIAILESRLNHKPWYKKAFHKEKKSKK